MCLVEYLRSLISLPSGTAIQIFRKAKNLQRILIGWGDILWPFGILGSLNTVILATWNAHDPVVWERAAVDEDMVQDSRSLEQSASFGSCNCDNFRIYFGLVVAVIFNADTISVYQRLESNPEELKEIVTMAEAYAQKNELDIQTGGTVQQQWEQVNSLIEDELQQANAPLGLGWHPEDLKNMTPSDWVIKILGWIVTALAVSLGAPFWFDLLKKLVNIKAAGNEPKA